MKKQQHNTIVNGAIILLGLVAIIFPFAHMRIPLWHTSVSPLSLIAIVTIVYLLYVFYAPIHKHFSTHRTVWFLTLLWLCYALVISLSSGTVHAVGIFIEWLVLPTIFGAFILAVLPQIPPDKLRTVGIVGIAVFGAVVLLSADSIGQTYDGRLQGLWPSPTHLAMLIAPLNIVLWGYILCANKHQSSLLLVLGSFFFLLLLSTQSIFALLSFVIGIGITFSYCHKRTRQKRFRAVLIIIALCGTLLSANTLYNRGADFFSNIARSSLASRAIIWQTTKDIIAQQPLTPHGFGTFQARYLHDQKYYPPYLEWAVPTPHSLYLMTYYVGGAFFLLIFLILCAEVLHQGVTTVHHKKKWPLTVLYATFIAILFHGLVDTPLYGVDVGYVFWFMLWGVVTYSDKA